MLKKISAYLSTPKGLATFNAILIIIAILTNALIQVFCRPTLWATLILTICFSNTILYPLLKKQNFLFYFSNFISGVSLGVFMYCILFLEQMNFIGVFAIFMAGFGLITYIPHFFTLQLLYRYLISYKNKLTKLVFLLGVLTFSVAAIFLNIKYKQALISIEKFKKSNYTYLDKNFMTEKILGMYFKYHTEFCEYDGWRPPLHEPALVIGQWFNGRQDPLSPDGIIRLDLKKRIQLYIKNFPDEKFKLDCACAANYSWDYHSDSLFKKQQ